MFCTCSGDISMSSGGCAGRPANPLPLPAVSTWHWHPNPVAGTAGLRGVQADVVQRGGSARIAFHAFSMVGWSLYSLLLQDLAAARGSPRMADVCGAVLDSAPETAVRSSHQRCRRRAWLLLCLGPCPRSELYSHPQSLPKVSE